MAIGDHFLNRVHEFWLAAQVYRRDQLVGNSAAKTVVATDFPRTSRRTIDIVNRLSAMTGWA